MTEPVQYPYSLKFSLGTIAVMILLMLLLSKNVIRANTTFTWVVFGVCTLIFLSLITLLIIKRLIPALKGNIALELDNEGINDYIRDVSIGWKDIRDIKLIRGRSASIMQINLKWESDYGSQISIPLRWVKGKDDEIYASTLTFLEHNTADFTRDLLS
jgi:hypothetical protein